MTKTADSVRIKVLSELVEEAREATTPRHAEAVDLERIINRIERGDQGKPDGAF